MVSGGGVQRLVRGLVEVTPYSLLRCSGMAYCMTRPRVSELSSNWVVRWPRRSSAQAPERGAVLDAFEDAEEGGGRLDGGVPGGSRDLEPVRGRVADEVADECRDQRVEEGAGDHLLVEVDELAGEPGALLGGAHVPDHVEVGELAGALQVGRRVSEADAEHRADHAPGVVVGLRAVDRHVDAQAVHRVQDLDGEQHLPADHVLLADRRTERGRVPAVLAAQVVADGGVQQAYLLRGGDEPATRLERVGLHQVDGELSGLGHPPGGVLQGVGGAEQFRHVRDDVAGRHRGEGQCGGDVDVVVDEEEPGLLHLAPVHPGRRRAGGVQVLAGHVGQVVGDGLADGGEVAHEGVELADFSSLEQRVHRRVGEFVPHEPQRVHGLLGVGHGDLPRVRAGGRWRRTPVGTARRRRARAAAPG